MANLNPERFLRPPFVYSIDFFGSTGKFVQSFDPDPDIPKYRPQNAVVFLLEPDHRVEIMPSDNGGTVGVRSNENLLFRYNRIGDIPSPHPFYKTGQAFNLMKPGERLEIFYDNHTPLGTFISRQNGIPPPQQLP